MSEKKTSTVNSLKETIRFWKREPKKYIELALYIKTKEKKVVKLKLNRAQNLIYRRIKKIKNQGQPIRMIILKARQEGVSTFCEAMIFENTVSSSNVNSLIVAHEPESTEEIFRMSKLYYDMLSEPVKPLKRYDNKKQLVFENPDEKTRSDNPGLRSKMVIATAGKVKIGRGLTIQNFHGSGWHFGKMEKS